MATTNTTQLNDNEKLFDQAVTTASLQADQLSQNADEWDEVANATPTQYTRTNYVKDILEQHKQSQPTQEEIKREQNKRKIAALGDGLVALSNMMGAVGGATPLQQQKTLSEAQKARFEEALKMRDGYKTRQERNAELSTAMQQQRAEDNYYSRLRNQEESQRKNAASNAIKARKAASDILTNLYAKAKALGISEEKAKSIIEKNTAAIQQGWAKTSAEVANKASQIKTRESGSTTVVTDDGNGNKTTVKTVGTTPVPTQAATPKPSSTPAPTPSSSAGGNGTKTKKRHGKAGGKGSTATAGGNSKTKTTANL